MYDTIPHLRRIALRPSPGDWAMLSGWWGRLYVAQMAGLMAQMGVV
jgi:hypothetical protein